LYQVAPVHILGITKISNSLIEKSRGNHEVSKFTVKNNFSERKKKIEIFINSETKITGPKTPNRLLLMQNAEENVFNGVYSTLCGSVRNFAKVGFGYCTSPHVGFLSF
jgi:hypothetical protein